MIQALWEYDLNAIREDLANGYTDFLYNALRGTGVTQYDNMSDEQLLHEMREYQLLGQSHEEVA